MTDTIGKRIRFRRKQLKMTQPTLGKAVGVSKQAIYQWENDLNQTFKEEQFDRLITALKTTKEYLKTGEAQEIGISDVNTNSYVITAKTENEKSALEILRVLAPEHQAAWLAEGYKMAEFTEIVRKDQKNKGQT